MMQQPSSNSCTSIMAPVVLLLLILAMVVGSDGAWCVCRSDAGNTALQKTLDYACGAGADCSTIHENGPCYNPNTVLAHCSYAANSYYQRKGQDPQACVFSGTAQLVSSDPSQPGCTYPASPSAAGTSGTPSSSSSSSSSTPSSPGSTLNPGSSSGTFNPNSPNTAGGTFGTLGPSGVGYDGNGAGPIARMGSSLCLTVIVIAFMALLN